MLTPNSWLLVIIGDDVDVLIATNGAKAAANAAAKLVGGAQGPAIERDELEQRLADPVAAAILARADGYDTSLPRVERRQGWRRVFNGKRETADAVPMRTIDHPAVSICIRWN